MFNFKCNMFGENKEGCNKFKAKLGFGKTKIRLLSHNTITKIKNKFKKSKSESDRREDPDSQLEFFSSLVKLVANQSCRVKLSFSCESASSDETLAKSKISTAETRTKVIKSGNENSNEDKLKGLGLLLYMKTLDFSMEWDRVNIKSKNDDDLDDVFIDDTESTDTSPIKENWHWKILLTERFWPPKQRREHYFPFTDEDKLRSAIINENDYFEDSFESFLLEENEQVVRHDFLSRFNPVTENRTIIVNWMTKVQRYLDLPNNLFFLSVYMLDQILDKVLVPETIYQLIAITVIWILSKVHLSTPVPLDKLPSLCDYFYETSQFIEMEVKILKILRFRLPLMEPTIFIDIYLKLLYLEKNELVKLCALYIVECSAVSTATEFSAHPPSLLAMAAVNWALCCLNRHRDNYFSQILPGATPAVVHRLEDVLRDGLSQAADQPLVPHRKYQALHLMKVSEKVTHLEPLPRPQH